MTYEQHLLSQFTYGHLPVNQQEVAKAFADRAGLIMTTMGPVPERAVALRQLLDERHYAIMKSETPKNVLDF